MSKVLNLSFIKNDVHTSECCPSCACETDIKTDGASDCEHCGHKNVLPCSECLYENGDDASMCDWNIDTGCTPFPQNMEVKDV